ncbi:hypothetical protein [Arcticibacterium luteifluviistationis]|uniref:DUF3185 domain-containing protein n=1 Tax=Arcticibacterium luteifluviistationis TaxID=1784714 RepID=A0A2Z4GH73_9BACT|nr:hypothetical protein [Arcticibacterium luteifluviistationis]AWW00428.1 hypothetical protein DJ013_20510 [Arcticibacterium luteifluviistationis]
MKSNKIIGILLIVGSLVLGYFGFNKVSNNDVSVEVLGLEIDASNKSGKEQGYMLLGLGLVVFVGGLYTTSKK